MSVTPGLGAFNKDKVANKFGIQLKNKDSNKQSQQPLTSSSEKKTVNTETSTITESKTVSDFRTKNESNGLKTKKNICRQSPSSKTPEPIRKSLENSIRSKSSLELVSTSTNNERRNSLHANVNHSKSLILVKSNESINCISPCLSSSSSNILLSPKPSTTMKRSSLILIDRDILLEPSLTERTSITKTTTTTTTTKRTVSPKASVNQLNISKSMTKTDAEIEHQKYQPLYKRQLSKTLDNPTSMTNKNKHQNEHTTISSNTMLKR
ncbi:unnamed protein product [Rotaria magnacalcarata]|uniref:Uncharacterized protein n=3 Tax=Rotaria magnacalcarata TaxID=392030 RepID=A0A816L7U1_9BILA|nr:unnamed protein product [Rotaria magnacalcarata]CAF1931865.1 unnamed protein product [Rotaria magnacalcarata]CAF2120601.1 unnamed protein product [Rotaria magnacalcarata]CAF3801196.1 unnamed protein product [Rotaria magnacalcarata]CAF4012682.1 unnamed protein product [Rotaria magnacalcarata]